MKTINPDMDYKNNAGLEFLKKAWPVYEKQNKLINKNFQKASRSGATMNRCLDAYHSLYTELYLLVEMNIMNVKTRRVNSIVIPNLDYPLVGEMLYRQVSTTKSTKELIEDIRNGLETIMIALKSIQEAKRQLEIIEDHDTLLILKCTYFFYRPPPSYGENKMENPSREELYQTVTLFNPVYKSYGYYKERIDELERKKYIIIVKDRKGGANGGHKKRRIFLTKKGKRTCLMLFDPSHEKLIK